MYNKKALNVSLGKFIKSNAYKDDIITDPRGQWAHPGQNTRIPSNQITMQGVPYPVWAQPNVGPGMMMQPGQDYNFPDADYVDEFPQMQRGGQWNQAAYDDSLSLYSAGNYLSDKLNEIAASPKNGAYEEFFNNHVAPYANAHNINDVFERLTTLNNASPKPSNVIERKLKSMQGIEGTARAMQFEKPMDKPYLEYNYTPTSDGGVLIAPIKEPIRPPLPPLPSLQTRPAQQLPQQIIPKELQQISKEDTVGKVKPPQDTTLWKKTPSGTSYPVQRPIKPEYLESRKVGFLQDGGEYEELELSDEEIQAYQANGYTVEELPIAQNGMQQDKEALWNATSQFFYDNPMDINLKKLRLSQSKQRPKMLKDQGAFIPGAGTLKPSDLIPVQTGEGYTGLPIYQRKGNEGKYFTLDEEYNIANTSRYDLQRMGKDEIYYLPNRYIDVLNQKQIGGPTQADSLQLYNNSRRVENYFTSKDYKPIMHIYSRNPDVFDNLEYDRKDFITLNSRGRLGSTTDKGSNGAVPLWQYHKNIDKNKFKQRENAFSILDTRSPMQLFDRRIQPTQYMGISNDKKYDPLFGDHVGIHGYDPISVKPSHMLTDEELKLRFKRHGAAGIEPSRIKALGLDPNAKGSTPQKQKEKPITLPTRSLQQIPQDNIQKELIQRPKENMTGKIKTPEDAVRWVQNSQTGTWYQKQRPVRPEYLESRRVGFLQRGGQWNQQAYNDSVAAYNFGLNEYLATWGDHADESTYKKWARLAPLGPWTNEDTKDSYYDNEINKLKVKPITALWDDVKTPVYRKPVMTKAMWEKSQPTIGSLPTRKLTSDTSRELVQQTFPETAPIKPMELAYRNQTNIDAEGNTTLVKVPYAAKDNGRWDLLDSPRVIDQRKQNGGEFIEMELTDEEIQQYRDAGYIVEYCEECNGLPTAGKGDEVKPRTLSEKKPKTRDATMLINQRVSQINSSWEDNRALDEARSAYAQEDERVKGAVQNILRLAENKDLNNIPTRESLSYIDQGRYFCSTHSCELARDAGFDKIDGTKHNIIPGNASAASYYRDPNSGYQFINSAKDSLPGDIVQMVDPQTGDYQGNTFAERDFPHHSMINKGRSINDDGNVYYNAIGGSRDNYGKTTYDLKDSRHWGWRYVGDTPKRKQDFLDAQKRSLANRPQGLPFRKLSDIEGSIDKSIDTRRSDAYNQKVTDIKNSGKNKRQIKQDLQSFHFKDGGEVMELTDKEIKQYKKNGYIIEYV